jgi:5-methylcytosine-specific restriction enzyme subunit McrC
VELSLKLLQQKSIGVSSMRTQEITGTLLDMAEIWELYVYHLLKTTVAGVEVVHTGREREASGYLFQNMDGRKLAALKPDILLRNPLSKQVLAVVDVKYKHMFASLFKPTGLERNDLYQIHAYMDAFSSPGILVYPDESEAQICQHQLGNPWSSFNQRSSLRFYGINGEFNEGESVTGLTLSEEQFCKGIRELIGLHQIALSEMQ